MGRRESSATAFLVRGDVPEASPSPRDHHDDGQVPPPLPLARPRKERRFLGTIVGSPTWARDPLSPFGLTRRLYLTQDR
eukprot:855783-Rhodomonas_salina.2